MSSRLSEIFTEAIAIEDASSRERYLQDTCGDDPALLDKVRALLAASEDDNDSLFRPFAVIPKEADSPTESTDLDLPTMFGAYRLEEKIGEGGMGIIYRATQIELQRVVALKMVRNAHLATKSEIKRFSAEARAAASLNHPGIVPVIESGKVEDQHFFSMGYIEGIDLAQLLKEFPLTIEQAISITKEIAKATQYAHNKGVVHRDLKPENILISFRDSPPDSPDHFQAHITDFGLAKRQEYDPGLTIAGEILGTPGYMSPEQAGSGTVVNEATDIYAIGALLYFLLTKRAPFEGDSVLEILGAVRNSTPPPPTSLRPFIPNDLEAICLKCLQKDPQNRYSSANDIFTDLENHLHGHPLNANPGGPINRLSKFCRRNPVLTLSGILGVFLIAALIYFPLKLKLSDARLEKENAATESAQKQVTQQKVHSELTRATQSVSTGNHRQAIIEFLNTAQLAKEAHDHQAEKSARWGLSDSFSKLWYKTGHFAALPGIRKIALSPKGKYLGIISSSEANSGPSIKYGLEIFDTKTQAKLFQKLGDLEYTDLCFHPSGNSLVVSTGLQQVTILDKKGPKFDATRTLDARDSRIKPLKHHSIGYLGDGDSIFSCGLAPNFGIWNLNSHPPLQGIIQADEDLRLTAISGDTSRIVANSMHDNMFGWDPVSRDRIFGPVFLGKEHIASQIAINHQGTKLAISSEEKNNITLYDITNWDLETTTPVSSQTIEHRAPLQMQFGKKTGSLFYLSKTGTLRVKKNSIEQDIAVPISRKDVKAFAVSDDESYLVTAHTKSNDIIIWKAGPFWANEFTLPKSSHGRTHSVGLDHTMMIGGKYHVRVFPGPREHLASRSPLPDIKSLPMAGEPLFILGSRSSDFILSLGQHGKDLWFTASKMDPKWEKRQVIIPFQKPVEVIFGPHENRGICFSKTLPNDNADNVAIIDLESKELQSYTIPNAAISSATISNLGDEKIIFASSSGKLMWFDLKLGKITREHSPVHQEITSIAANSDHGTLALGLDNGEIHLYNEDSMKLQRIFVHDESVSLLSFGGNGLLIVAGGNENHLNIWEIASGLTIGNKLTHQEKIVDLDVCDATQSIITATAGGHVKVWPIPTKDDRDLETIREEAKKLLLITE